MLSADLFEARMIWVQVAGCCWVWGLGFRVWGLGVWGLGFRFWGLGLVMTIMGAINPRNQRARTLLGHRLEWRLILCTLGRNPNLV